MFLIYLTSYVERHPQEQYNVKVLSYPILIVVVQQVMPTDTFECSGLFLYNLKVPSLDLGHEIR